MLRKSFVSLALIFCLTQQLKPQDQPHDVSRDVQNPVLWRDPGNVESLDFAGGPGGRDRAPQPPFVYREEGKYGTNQKVIVADARGAVWEVKWGPEVKAEPFVTRLLWAVGYTVDSSYYVREGHIDGAEHLDRSSPRHDRRTSVINRLEGNAFSRARFELRDPRVTYMPDLSWAWESNPFVTTPEFAGLKIMTMLVSSWDTKDSTSSSPPNTAIIKVKTDAGSEESHFIVNDWGGSMGRWGGPTTHSTWDCQGYRQQTADFVKGLDKNGMVRFGYSGQTSSLSKNISPDHVGWLLLYLGRITDDQIRDGLRASNADDAEVECFTTSIRSRIEQLRDIGGRLVLHKSRE
jgi:hypothetical protein